ncbi:MAG: efflux transporter outer membrane subunit [Pelomonas sp.]|nr:efflux transporter outer membrane subunit [Roseateles sp.]
MWRSKQSRRARGPAVALAALVSALILAGCAVGPDYQRPELPAAPAQFKEDGPWRPAVPAAADAKQPWWQAFGDADLNALVVQANDANQTLRQAESQLRNAQALVLNAGAQLWPIVGVTGQIGRERQFSPNTPLDTRGAAIAASWEPDFWGRARRGLESAQASAAASGDDLAAARLAVQATVASSYVQLRIDDAMLDLLDRTVDAYRASLGVAQAQERAGVATPADVALAQSTLASAEAQRVDLRLARVQGEHALAVLLGRLPSDFSLPAKPLALSLPAIPPLLPSRLLERRPDVAGAEQRVRAANAQIGVAKAAWFPNLSLTASDGVTALGKWAGAPLRVWSLGASVTAPLFDPGQLRSLNDQARAAYDGAVASYRQNVLAAFQDVEDQLAAQRELARERVFEDQALAAAVEAERVLARQYEVGSASYVSLVTAQANSLAAGRTALQLQGRELLAHVALIRALGGGFGTEP